LESEKTQQVVRPQFEWLTCIKAPCWAFVNQRVNVAHFLRPLSIVEAAFSISLIKISCHPDLKN
jgi:hypothetical protein